MMLLALQRISHDISDDGSQSDAINLSLTLSLITSTAATSVILASIVDVCLVIAMRVSAIVLVRRHTESPDIDIG